MERLEFHRPRVSARFLFKVSRLFGLFSFLGAVGLPNPVAPRYRSLTRTGLVAALDVEARVLGHAVRRSDGLSSLADGALVAVSGIGCAAAAVAARSLSDAGATALMSFGLAGGLDPALAAGNIVLPSEVICAEGTRFPTSVEWRAQLGAAIGTQRAISGGKLLTSLHLIDSVAGKAAAFRDTHAVAVDMESLAVARIAAELSLPFMAARVVVDTATDALPRTVAAASRGGPLNIGRLLVGVALAPLDIVGLVRLARRYRAAIRSLAIVARARAA